MAMLRFRSLCLLVVSGCALDEPPAPDPIPVDDAPVAASIVRVAEPIPGRYIVALAVPETAKSIAAADVPRITDEIAGHYPIAIEKRWQHAFVGFAAEMSEATALALAADPRVELVQEDGVVRASDTQ